MLPVQNKASVIVSPSPDYIQEFNKKDTVFTTLITVGRGRLNYPLFYIQYYRVHRNRKLGHLWEYLLFMQIVMKSP